MTGAYAGLLAFDAIALGVGYALLYGLGLVRARDAVLRHLGLAFVAGWALTGVGIAIGVSLGIDPVVTRVLPVALVLAAVPLAARRFFPTLERRRAPRETEPLLRVAALLGGALIVLALATAVIVGFKAPADGTWDVWAFWLPKAKAIYFFHGLNTGLGGYTTYANVNYPPLMPAMTAASFHFMGGTHAALLPFQQSLLGVAFIGSLLALLSPLVPRWILNPSLAMLTLAPEFWSRMTAVLPDQTLAYLIALAAVVCILWLREPQRAWLGLGVVFIAAATLTKNEGLFLCGLLVVAVLGAALVLHRRRALPAVVLVAGLAAIEPWHHWLTAHHFPVASPEYDWHDLLRPTFLDHNLWKLRYATHAMLGFAFNGSTWLLLLPLALASLVVVAGTLRVLTAVVAFWLGAAFLGLASVYWIGRPDVHWYVSTSAERVVATLPLVAGALLPLLLGLALERHGDSGSSGR